MKPFRPMLAATLEHNDYDKIKYPIAASYKLDGIRAVIFDGVAYSRSMKPLPNKEIQEWAYRHKQALEGLDGEFIVGLPTDENVFNNTQSFVMSIDKQHGDFTFWVFDKVDSNAEFFVRLTELNLIVNHYCPDNVIALKHDLVKSKQELIELENQAYALNYEGLILRAVDGEYKQGRSTLKQQGMLKIKPFVDKEFKIVGYKLLETNNNEQYVDERGFTVRSSHKENKVKQELIGSLELEDEQGNRFFSGSGLTLEERARLYEMRAELTDWLCTVKYMPYGGYDVPRIGVIKGLRHKDDTSK